MIEPENPNHPQANPGAANASRPPWLTGAFPELRPGPPWVMQEMIASEPELVIPILSSPAAASIAQIILDATQSGLPVVTTGCGTSEHGALAAAVLVEAGLASLGMKNARVECRQAFDELLDPRQGGVLLAVSHGGGSAATVEAIKAARLAGATTVLITARPDAAASHAADHVFLTPKIDRSWCHTVAYMSSILAEAAVAAAICGEALPAEDLRSFLRQVETPRHPASRIANSLADCSRLIITGQGPDLIAARELALKIEEGARLPAVAIHLETLLHGHLAATDGHTGLVFLLCCGTPGAQRREARASIAASAARRIGLRCASITALHTDFAEPLSDAGRIVLPQDKPDRKPVAALTFAVAGSAIALQQLALALAHARGSNPDLIRREQEPYREAARIAEKGSW